MRLPPRRHAWHAGPLSLLVAFAACTEPIEPEPQPGFTFTGGGATDTIEAVLPRAITIELRNARGRAAAGVTVYVTGRGLFSAARAPNQLSTPFEVLWPKEVGLDDSGRATLYVRLGRVPGEAWLFVSDGQVRDSVSFRVLPGTFAKHFVLPVDSAVAMGTTYSVRLRRSDRLGNLRPELPTGVVYRSVNANLTVDGMGTVSARAIGRGAVELRTATTVDTAWVSVVPQGTLAVGGAESAFADGGDLHLQDLDGGNRRTIATGIPKRASPGWSADGSRLVIAGLRMVTVSGQTAQLETDLLAEAGEFSRDGEWVYFTARRSTDPQRVTQVWRIRAGGTGLEQLSPHGVNAYGATPSPDGTRIAYIQFEPGRRALVIRTLTTGAERILHSSADDLLGTPRWSPGGEWIAYTVASSRISERVCLLWSGPGYPICVIPWTVLGHVLRVVRPDGSETRDLLPLGEAGPGHVFLGSLRYIDRASEAEPFVVSWSPDGEWLIGKAFYPDLRLTLVRFATGERLPLNGSTVPFSMPAWKP